MSSTLDFPCPECGNTIRLPPTARGKKVRCKACETVFVVPMDGDSDNSGPAANKPARPATARPAAKVPTAKVATAKTAKPAAGKPAPPVEEAKAPIGFAKDDDEDDATPMEVIIADEAPRCPGCATELDPPDARVCINCGYNLIIRKKHGSKKVYETTKEDYFQWWLPAFIWIAVMIVVLACEIICILYMSRFVHENMEFLVKDEKNPITNKPQYYLNPDCFTTCFSVIALFVLIYGLRFTIKRLVYEREPPEIEKKSSK